MAAAAATICHQNLDNLPSIYNRTRVLNTPPNPNLLLGSCLSRGHPPLNVFFGDLDFVGVLGLTDWIDLPLPLPPPVPEVLR